MRGGLWMLVGTALLSGCYVYNPTTSPPAPGSEVRVHVTSEAAVRVGDLLGDPSREVDGRLQAAGDTVRVSVLTGREVSDFARARDFRSELAFPRSQVEGISLRRFSWPRSLLVGAAAGGLVGLAVGQVVAGGDADDGDGDNGGGPVTLLFRIPIFGW